MLHDDLPEWHPDTADACDMADDGLFIHDIDPLVPERPEAFIDEEPLAPCDPSPVNALINDPFMRGDQ